MNAAIMHEPVRRAERVGDELRRPWPAIDLAGWQARAGRYRARFALTRDDVEAAQRLRYRVFASELACGTEGPAGLAIDRDRYDASCDHLLVFDERREVVGTYRMLTANAARACRGFYSAREFDLHALPSDLLDRGIELGRACVAAEHRGSRALLLLWKGIAAYLAHHRRSFLFGCSSLDSRDARAIDRLSAELTRRGHVHPHLRVEPAPGFELSSEPELPDSGQTAPLPPLLAMYLRLGAQVVLEPAFDQAFGTVDYFTVLDASALDAGTLRRFAP